MRDVRVRLARTIMPVAEAEIVGRHPALVAVLERATGEVSRLSARRSSRKYAADRDGGGGGQNMTHC